MVHFVCWAARDSSLSTIMLNWVVCWIANNVACAFCYPPNTALKTKTKLAPPMLSAWRIWLAEHQRSDSEACFLHCDNENDDNMIMLTVTDHAVLHCLTSLLCGREALSVMPHMLCQSIEAVDIRPFSPNQLTLLLKFPPLLTLKQAFRLV